MQIKAVALFDFDGTLCKGDSIFPFLLYAVRKGVAPKKQLFKALKAFLMQRGHSDRVVWAKEESLSFICGRSRVEMDNIARAFFRDKLCPCFFRRGQEEMQRLKEEGKTILIVSASPDIYMRVLPEFMPLVDKVIATECIMDEAQRYTGKIRSNCKGKEKFLLLERYMEENGWTIDSTASCAYGDSASDEIMLRMTGQPVLVNPKSGLVKALPKARKVLWN